MEYLPLDINKQINIHVYISVSVEPDIYENMFSITQNDGKIILLESFQNVTNDTMRDDFIVKLYIQVNMFILKRTC